MIVQPIFLPVSQNLVAAEEPPLITAVFSGNLKKLEELLKCVNINAKDNEGCTALMHAAYLNRVDMMELILKEKDPIKLNEKNLAGETALMQAAQNNSVAAMEWLMTAGADVDIVDDSGSTAFFAYIGSLQGEDINVELVNSFLKHGLDLDARDIEGRNALMLLAEVAGLGAKEVLLRAMHYDQNLINAIDNNDCTVLHHAAYRSDFAFAKKLVEFGVKVSWVAGDAKKAEDVAREAGAIEMADFLRAAERQQKRESLAAAKLLMPNALAQWTENYGSIESTGIDDRNDALRESVDFTDVLEVREFTPAVYEKDYSELDLNDRMRRRK